MSAIPGVGQVAGPALFTAMGAGEAADRAVQAGASDEDVAHAALLGVGAGATDILPVEMLLGRIPPPGRRVIGQLVKRFGGKRVARAAGRIGVQGLVEATQEGGQQAFQNLIAREVHSPEQAIAEGVEEGAGIGGIVGGIAQLTREGVLGVVGRRSRSTRGERARAVNEVPPLTEEDHASPIPDDLIREGREKVADDAAAGHASEFLKVEGLPGVGQPVRIVQGASEAVEGVVSDAWSDDRPGMTIESVHGDALNFYLDELRQAGATVTGLPMPASEAELVNAREQSAEERRKTEEQTVEAAVKADRETMEEARDVGPSDTAPEVAPAVASPRGEREAVAPVAPEDSDAGYCPMLRLKSRRGPRPGWRRLRHAWWHRKTCGLSVWSLQHPEEARDVGPSEVLQPEVAPAVCRHPGGERDVGRSGCAEEATEAVTARCCAKSRRGPRPGWRPEARMVPHRKTETARAGRCGTRTRNRCAEEAAPTVTPTETGTVPVESAVEVPPRDARLVTPGAPPSAGTVPPESAAQVLPEDFASSAFTPRAAAPVDT